MWNRENKAKDVDETRVSAAEFSDRDACIDEIDATPPSSPLETELQQSLETLSISKPSLITNKISYTKLPVRRLSEKEIVCKQEEPSALFEDHVSESKWFPFPKSGGWSDKKRHLAKESDPRINDRVFIASLPSLDEYEAEEVPSVVVRPNEKRNLAAKKPVSKSKQWKLPPLFQKLVYGESSKPKLETELKPIPEKGVRKKTKKGEKVSPKPATSSFISKIKYSKDKPRIVSDPVTMVRTFTDPDLLRASHKTLSDEIYDDEESAIRQREALQHIPESEAHSNAKIRFDQRYEVKKQIGSGGHSTVRIAYRRPDGLMVVCKFIKQSSVWHWHKSKTGTCHPLEIRVMQDIQSKKPNNFIRYFEHYEMSGRFVIVMEFMGADWMDLYDFIEIHGPVKEQISLEIFAKIVDTVVSLHDAGFYHNDIKDENILINSRTRDIKLIDFGSATCIPRASEKPALCENFYGTKKFAAPEAVRRELYNPECQEAWALGTLLYVILFKLDPFTTDEEILEVDIGKRIEKYRIAARSGRETKEVGANEWTGILGDLSDEVVWAICQMMEKTPEKRISVRNIQKLGILAKART